MRNRAFAIFAGLAAFALGTATLASADDVKLKTSPSGNVIAFENGAKFEIAREQTAGKMTFKLVDSSVKITDAPVVTLQTSEGPQEVTLIPVAGQTNTWYFTNDVIRRDRFDGTMAIVVSPSSPAARRPGHGHRGRPACRRRRASPPTATRTPAC